MSWKDIFIAIQKGIIPSKKELVDGTTTVGNANKLGGKGASEYVTTNGGTANNITLKNAASGYGMIYKNHTDTADYGTYLKDISADGKEVAVYLAAKDNSFSFKNNSGTWNDIATTADLANYLPTSGAMAKEFSVSTTAEIGLPTVAFKNSSGVVRQYLSYNTTNGVFERYDGNAENLKTILDAGNVGDYAVPKQASTYSNLNFDTAIENATYYGGGSPAQEGATNYPSDSTGTLATFGNSTVCTQMYFTYDGTVYNRSRYHSIGWSPWKELHHDGNSAKVAIQSTAPTDTSALWVW